MDKAEIADVMIKVIVVDDKKSLFIEREILERAGSLLSGKIHTKRFQYATKIPESKGNEHDDKKIALNSISKIKNIDIAILDIEYEDEFEDGYVNEPIVRLIRELDKFHPNCQILIMSKYQSHPNFTDSLILNEMPNRKFFAVPKSLGKTQFKEHGKAFYAILEKRLKYLVSKLNGHELSILFKYLKSSVFSHEEIEKLNSALGVNVDTLFVHYDFTRLNIKSKLENLTNVVIDFPDFSNNGGPHSKYWLEGDSKRKYGFRDYYMQYYEDLYSEEKYTLDSLIKGAKECCEKLILDINNGTSNFSETKTCIDRYRVKKLRYDLKEEKVNGRIPNWEMLNFVDFLRKRLLFIGMYFGAYLSAPSINLLLQGNSYAYDKKGNLTKQIMTYLRFAIEDQLSTSNDNLIENFEEADQHRNKYRRSEHNKNELILLIPYERKYENIFDSLANYEKEFCFKICEFSSKLNLESKHMEHINYILEYSNNYKSLKE